MRPTVATARRFTVLALPGSIRRNSYNRMLLRAADDVAPVDIAIRHCEVLPEIPLFNEDLEADEKLPEPVTKLDQLVAEADGILLSTPEYNQSIPGVLKNAIDWLSRSTNLAGKPVAVIGATSGRWGTRLAQAATRQTLMATGAFVLPGPALYVSNASHCFDVNGQLLDMAAREGLAAVTAELARWVRTFHDRGEHAGRAALP
ncbi:MAG: NAD(P)H-dependent oxidoreductase [Kofleriaceae bacterium]|nr:NAD(P)H-dependent oxidoreductase [Kofleriaceae bacterium]